MISILLARTSHKIKKNLCVTRRIHDIVIRLIMFIILYLLCLL